MTVETLGGAGLWRGILWTLASPTTLVLLAACASHGGAHPKNLEGTTEPPTDGRFDSEANAGVPGPPPPASLPTLALAPGCKVYGSNEAIVRVRPEILRVEVRLELSHPVRPELFELLLTWLALSFAESPSPRFWTTLGPQSALLLPTTDELGRVLPLLTDPNSLPSPLIAKAISSTKSQLSRALTDHPEAHAEWVLAVASQREVPPLVGPAYLNAVPWTALESSARDALGAARIEASVPSTAALPSISSCAPQSDPVPRTPQAAPSANAPQPARAPTEQRGRTPLLWLRRTGEENMLVAFTLKDDVPETHAQLLSSRMIEEVQPSLIGLQPLPHLVGAYAHVPQTNIEGALLALHAAYDRLTLSSAVRPRLFVYVAGPESAGSKLSESFARSWVSETAGTIPGP